MSRIRIRDATNTLRTVARIRMRDATNTLRTIQRIRIRDAANVLRTVYQFMSASLDTNLAYGTNGAPAPTSSGTVTSNAINVTVVGGTAPFTYTWAYVDGSGGITVTSPGTASTTFSATVHDGVNKEATYQVTVVDAIGTTIVLDNIIVFLEFFMV